MTQLSIRQQHWAVSVIILSQTVTFLSLSFSPAFLPFFLEDELGVHDPDALKLWIGVTTGVTPLLVMICAPFWGVAADRLGQKPMMVRALAGSGLLVALGALTQDPWQFLITRFLLGVLTGVNAPTIALISEIVPRDRLGRSLSLAQIGRVVGFATGPVLGGIAADALGPRGAFILGGFMGVGSALLLQLFVPKPASSRPTSRSAGLLAGLSYVRKHAQLLPLITVIFLVQFGNDIPIPFIPILVQSLAGERENLATLSGFIVSAGTLSVALGGLAAAHLAERRGYVPVLLVACLMCSGFLMLQALASAPEQLFILRFLMGLSFGATLPLLNAMAGMHVPADRRGLVFGVTTSANAGAGLGGPIVGSSVAIALGLSSAFAAGGLVMVIAAVVVWRGVREPTDERPEEARAAG